MATAGDIIARFELNLRCDNCLRESCQAVDIPDVPDAPTTVAELLASSVLDRQPYVCRRCDGTIGVLVSVKSFGRPAGPSSRKGRRMTSAKRKTLYVVMGFKRDKRGRLVKDEPVQMDSSGAAERRARRYAEAGGGAIATEQAGTPETGDWEEPKIIVQVGEIPGAVLEEIAAAA